MALSGSTNFNMTASDLINASYRAIRVLNAGGTLTSAELTDGIEALNILLKSLIPHGLTMWQMKNKSITLVASQGTYTLGPSGADVTMDRPEQITSAYLRNSSNVDLELEKYSRDSYRLIPNKLGEGKPTGFYYDPQRTTGQISLWLVPDTASAAEYTLEINYRKPIDDIDVSTDDIEIPVTWYHAIKWNLAKELAIEFDVPDKTWNRVSKMAERSLERAMQGDVENDTSVYFQEDKY